MSIDSEWEFAGAGPDRQPFIIDGLDVWKHEWKDTRQRARVKDPLYQQDFTFHIYEIGSPGRVVTFAAGEFSNCMWGFYIRKQAALTMRRTDFVVKFEPHIIAEIRLLPTSEGGPAGPTPSNIFGCPVGIGGEYFDMRMDLSGIGSLSPGSTARVPIRFLWPQYVRELLRVGSEFTLWEGRTIGHGRVIEVYQSLTA